MEVITAKYELIIYDGGERIEFKRIDNSQEVIDYSKCSSRISQILEIVTEMRKQLSNRTNVSDIEIYTSAINEVARNLKVTNTTISDKVTRQLDLTADQARSLIFDYLRNGSPDLKNLLLKKVGKNTKISDISVIEKILK
ncbi:hypothetical protein [Alkaliphilus peptidifermentans]|uniref:Uncharacterized protein n=1 Tax=Alkaliphilus peptidifermentans DSM 18978 TaxID=1120976 RepID=A0A1G5EHQ4_9FIRM|nr:hypothetical protein [Alkaliphilus peptidifermentans]SCY25988.1 hypothetical protein SAMN03080606_01150 [Alkaliphilus peptidifermentans DSM 18978]